MDFMCEKFCDAQIRHKNQYSPQILPLYGIWNELVVRADYYNRQSLTLAVPIIMGNV